MRVVVQRVSAAKGEVDGHITGAIGAGLLVLAGFKESDADANLRWMVANLTRLRIFADADGLMNHSVVDANAEILVVSQFSLFASTRESNRPSWSRAARPAVVQPLFARFVEYLEGALGSSVPTGGVFAAGMQVHLINDGPLTISIDSRHPE